MQHFFTCERLTWDRYRTDWTGGETQYFKSFRKALQRYETIRAQLGPADTLQAEFLGCPSLKGSSLSGRVECRETNEAS